MTSAAGAIDRYRRRLDPSSRYRSPAHVTVLYPFMDPSKISEDVIGQLRALFSQSDGFDFTLSEVRWFDDRVVYLAPTPVTPFLELTAAVSAAFPQYPPYEGAFAEVVPHVCVGRDAPKLFLQIAGRLVKRRLPITSTATEVWLMTIGDPEPFYSRKQVFSLRGVRSST